MQLPSPVPATLQCSCPLFQPHSNAAAPPLFSSDNQTQLPPSFPATTRAQMPYQSAQRDRTPVIATKCSECVGHGPGVRQEVRGAEPLRAHRVEQVLHGVASAQRAVKLHNAASLGAPGRAVRHDLQNAWG
eukprot:364608-Chlamydomonas_euryale.AAC.4